MKEIPGRKFENLGKIHICNQGEESLKERRRGERRFNKTNEEVLVRMRSGSIKKKIKL